MMVLLRYVTVCGSGARMLRIKGVRLECDIGNTTFIMCPATHASQYVSWLFCAPVTIDIKGVDKPECLDFIGGPCLECCLIAMRYTVETIQSIPPHYIHTWLMLTTQIAPDRNFEAYT